MSPLQLTSAYASLAAELTRKEIKSIGGYTLGKTIGEGSFGKVRIGVHRLTNTRVAIKQVPKSIPFSTDPSSPLSLLTREIHHHRRLRHPHILALYEIIATESSIYLVTELCTGGELFDYLVEKGRLSIRETRRIFGQLVLGVAHLHGKGVVHRDLKLENVLLDERVNVKIADLGFGREFEKGRWMETWVGTLGYCAPEVVAAKRYLGEEVDIWSLGVILYTLLTGSLPFDDDDEAIMKAKILKCDYEIPAWLDEDASDLIRSILQLDPLRRLSLRGMLAHPFFTRPPAPIIHESHHRHTASPHPTPNLPDPIPEENAFPLDHAPHSSPLHTLAASDFSDSSFYSAESESGVDGERTRSGATTPITSEEGSIEPQRSSLVKEWKKKAADQSGTGLATLHQRNASQTTIRRETELGVAGEPTVSNDSTPRAAKRTSPLLGSLTSTTEEDDDEGPANQHYPAYLSAYNSSLLPLPPPLQRNISSTSTLSTNTTATHSLPSSPLPGSMTVHSRTPSRTKRRSVGSTFSERLFSLDEESAAHSHTRIDYLAMLSSPELEPLSTELERELLDSLTRLGFDSGQIVHSIKTDACDSSAAVWWMLKRKAEEREKEKEERSSSVLGSLRGKANSDITDRGRMGGEEERSETRKGAPLREIQSLFGVGEVEDEVDVDSTKLTPGSEDGDDNSSIRYIASPKVAPHVASESDDDDVTTTQGIGYSVQHPATVSAPLFPYFSTLEFDSDAEPNVCSPFDQTRASPPRPTRVPPASPETPRAATSTLDLTAEAFIEAKRKRGRSSSVNMLVRATSLLGNTLALKKSADSALKENREKDKGGEETSRSLEDGGRLTPSSLALGGLFHRKTSVTLDDMRFSLAERTDRTTSPPQTIPIESTARTPPPHPSTLASSPPLSTKSSPHPSYQGMTASASQDTFNTVSSSSSNKRSHTSAPKKSKGNLFSNFRLWFGDDRRKPKRKMSAGGGAGSNPATPYGPAGSVRGGSISSRRGMRQDGSFIGSPLKRPVLGSRRSSSASLAPPSQSRRSSLNSVRRTRPEQNSPLPGSMATFVAGGGAGLQRRKSDGSRTSASDREPSSRPPSVRSNSGLSNSGTGSRRPHHSKGGSFSSSGSFRAYVANNPTLSPKDVYRRPPTSTTVRRQHQSASRHSRQRSASSSLNTRHSSSSSIEGDDLDIGADEPPNTEAILEEDETAEEERTAEERQRTLRQLSGDYSQLTMRPPSAASTSRVSLESSHLSNGRHSPIIFTAHKTRHIFGTPSQPSLSSISRKSSHSTIRPALRDVFAQKDAEGEWIDEADDLGGYGGGLGQSPTRSGFRSDSISSIASTNSSIFSSSASGSTGKSSSLSNHAEMKNAQSEGAGGASMFEGRYAGVMPQSAGEATVALGGAAAWRAAQGNRGAGFRSAVVIEEEEEEEE